jgi:hypothetical protein
LNSREVASFNCETSCAASSVITFHHDVPTRKPT